MPAIISNDLRIFNADSFQRTVETQPVYAVIGKESSWDNDSVPPVPIDSDEEKTQLFRDMLAMKRVNATNIKSVCPRIDWETGDVYDEYRNDASMIDDPQPETGNFRRFYVLTDEFNVYKCISNNNRSESTVRPTGSSTTSFETGDGYVWKYMFTLKSVDVLSFLTDEWMPCYTLKANDGSSQWQVQQQAVDGSIEHIVVENGGTGYNPSNPPIVEVVGDGQGAAAETEVDADTGEIVRVVMTDIGSGYTEASISLSNTQGGSGASLKPVLSPIGGHGSDPKSELGAIYKMIRVQLQGDENGVFPATEYRQIGLVSQPMSTDTGTKLFAADQNADSFSEGQLITGQSTGATGIIRSTDVDGVFLYLSDVEGQFSQGETVSNSDNITLEINDIKNDVNIPLISLVANKDDVVSRTGKFLYYSNREPITRTGDQREDFRFIIQQ